MSGVPKKPNLAGDVRMPERGHAFSATVSVPRSSHGHGNDAERKSRHHTADPSYRDAQDYVSAPPQHAHAHQHRHHENTTADNITVPASLERIFHPIVSAYAASAMLPTHHPHGAVTCR